MKKKKKVPLSGLGRLHKNAFFEKTPIGGWNFISQSKTRKEVVFWYAVCASFMVAALVSAYMVYVEYSAHYTRSQVKFHTSTKLVQMPNMTLQLKLPISDFLSYVHLPFIYNYTLEYLLEYASSLHITPKLQMLFIQLCPPKFEDDYFTELSSKILAEETALLSKHDLQGFININQHTAYPLSIEKLSASEILKQWNETIDENGSKFRKFWKNLLSMSASEQASQDVTAKTRDLTDGPLMARANDTLLKLLLLDSAKNEDQPKDTKISVDRLFRDVINELGSVIHIATAKCHLEWRDWTLNKIERRNGDQVIDQMFVFDIIPESGTKHLQLDIYSYFFMWQKRLIEVMIELVIESGISPTICDGYKDFQPFVKMHTAQYMRLQTDLMIGDVGVLPTAAFATDVQITPVHHFTSHIEDCLMSNTVCLDECKIKQHMIDCACLPWTLVMVSGDDQTPVCASQCPSSNDIEKQCEMECKMRLKHPCNHTLFHAATYLSKDTMTDFDPRIMGLDIKLVDSHNFVQSIEEYQMTFSDFLSQIGGALEFWSGINILCLVHLFVFIVMQLKDSQLLKNVLLKLFKPDETSVEKFSKDTVIRQVDELEEEFDGFIRRIRKRMHKLFPLVYNPEKQSKLSWIRDHPFFNETPMAGFSYMTAAEHLSDLVFWMMTIAVFIVIAIVNVRSSLSHFFGRPTRTIITPSMSLDSDENVAFQNMTLRLHLPLFILSDFEISPIYDPDTKQSLTTLEKLYDNIAIGLTVYDLADLMLDKWKTAFLNNSWPGIDTTYENDVSSLSGSNGFNEHAAVLRDSLESLYQFSAAKDQASWEVVQKEMFAHIWAPLMHKTKDLFIELLMLSSLMKDTNIQLDPSFGGGYSSQKSTKQVLEEQGIEAEQILADAYNKLNQLIYVGIDPADSKIFVTDIWFEDAYYVVLQTKILLPQKTSELKIEVYSLAYNWLVMVEDWLMGLEEKDEFYYLAQINSVDLVSTGLRIMALSYAKARFSGTHADLAMRNQIVYDYEMQLKWRLLSHTEDCNKEPFTICFEQCQSDEYLRECDCYPIQLYHIKRDSESKLCQEPCLSPDLIKEVCSKKCTNHCEAHVVEPLPHSEKEVDVWDSSKIPLISAHFVLAKNLYPQVTVEYQLTSGELFGQLGGVLDFWVGLNLLAVIHLAAYILKRLGKLHKASKQVTAETKLSKAANLQEEISDLRCEIESEMRAQKDICMKAPKQNKDSDTNTWKKKFIWIWKNEFFASTSLTGFDFIVAAKSIFEVVFWWLLISLFFVFTYISVVKVAKEFQSRPTHLNARLPAEHEDLQMGNITLDFSILFVNFLQVNPTSLIYKFDETHAGTIAKQIACSHDIGDSFYYVQMLAEDMFTDWLHMLKTWKQLFTDLKSTKRPFYGKSTLDEWQAKLNEGKANLTNYLNSKGHNKMPQKTNDKAKVKDEILTILNGPMQHAKYAAFRFMLLESLIKGHDPWKKLYSSLANISNHAFVTQLMPLIPFPVEITGQYKTVQFSTNELFDTALDDLSHMINIHTAGAPGVKVFLQNWEYKPTRQSDDYYMFRDQSMKVLLTVPENATEFTLEVRSFMHMWHFTLLSAISEYFAALGLGEDAVCGKKDIGEVNIQQAEHYEAWKISALDAIVMKANFVGDSVELYPHLQRYDLTLIPSTNFKSETDSCYKGSFSQCNDRCMHQIYLENCQCVPWTLTYLTLKATETICKQPCLEALEAKEKCSADCESKLFHPCKVNIYRAYLRPENYYVDHLSHIPMYSFKIKIDKTSNHIVYVESYEMSFGGFIGQLGGLLDLWLGINLLSVIHLIVFVLKKIICKGQLEEEENSTDELARIERVKQRLIGELDEISKQIQLQIIKIKPIAIAAESKEESISRK